MEMIEILRTAENVLFLKNNHGTDIQMAGDNGIQEYDSFIAFKLHDQIKGGPDKLMNVDLKGYFLCSQTVGKRMIEQKKGNIINIATQFAFKAAQLEMGAYGVAKAGVVMMTRFLARELSAHGIRVNGIAPGITKTDFSRKTWSNPELLKTIEDSLPLGRMGEADDMADAALFLASDASRYITGETILMDGGGLL